MRILALSAPFTIAFIALGCGSSHGSAAPGDPSPNACANGCWTPDADDLSFLQSFCALTVACATNNGIADATVAHCTTAFDAGAGLSDDASLRAACLAELQSLSNTPSCVPEVWHLDDPCVRVFDEPSGPQQPGQRCARNADCAGSAGTVTACFGNPANLTSACVRMAPGQAGSGTCIAEMNENGVNLYDPDYNPSVNVAPVFSGTVCQRRSGLYCDISGTGPRQCETLKAGGAPCTFQNECSSQMCTIPVNSLTGTCAPVVGVGESCWSGATQNAACDETSYCVTSNDGGVLTGACASRLAAGATCSSDDMCLSNHCACVDASCAAHQCSVQSSAEQFAMQALAVFL